MSVLFDLQYSQALRCSPVFKVFYFVGGLLFFCGRLCSVTRFFIENLNGKYMLSMKLENGYE
jgi:hypothetical protein